MIVAGIGCRRDCSAEDILALVARAIDVGGCRLDAIAAPASKLAEAGLHAAAKSLGLRLLAVDAREIEAAQPRCVTFSETVRRHVGVASVAEAAALAAAGPASRLVVPRLTAPRVTCAVARGSAP